MFISTDITINGTKLPPTDYGGISVSEHKIWSKNAGRNSSTGRFTGDIIALKCDITLKWSVLWDDDFQLINSIFNSFNASNLAVKWCRSKAHGYRTDYFYAAEPTYTKTVCENGKTKYTDYQITLIQC